MSIKFASLTSNSEMKAKLNRPEVVSLSDDIVISVQNLSKMYMLYDNPQDRLKQSLFWRMGRNYGRSFWALQDVSFDVRRGEIVGIIGRNGSGKSTLLEIIAGVLQPTIGNVQVNGRIAALLELGSGFNPEYTGRENVFLNGTMLGLSRMEIKKSYDEIVDFADIGEFIDQPVKYYSSGMYVRLAFAIQACIFPDILIVDEALSVGDEKFQRKCFDYIERLRLKGCAILLVSHSVSTVEKFCNQALLLHKGQLQSIGKAKEIIDLYHAMLYSDEKAYLRYLNTNTTDNCDTLSTVALTHDINYKKNLVDEKKDTDARALIVSWNILDVNENHCEYFYSGDNIKIRFLIRVFFPINEVQAGLLIRTVEGVTAFGTSSLYRNANYHNAEPGAELQVEFDVGANLCSGTYFVTIAIAEAISHLDMRYLDRKTDVIIVKIVEKQFLSAGIAALDSKVSINKVGGVQ